jgi:hypothetical protein
MIQLSVKIDGRLDELMLNEVRAGERAVTSAMRDAGATLKGIWRADIAGSGLGTRLANTVRSQVYPQAQPSLDAAALVFTKAPKIIGAHERGALIRSVDGFWLAIPTKAAGRGARGGRITPAEWEARTGRRLRFVFRSGLSGLLVDDGTVRSGNAPAFGQRAKRGFRNRTVPIFVLVPQAKLPKRLKLYDKAESVHAAVPAQIVAKWRGLSAL